MNYGFGGNIEESGEKEAVLDILENLEDPELNVFDVGAHQGAFSKFLLSNLDKEINIHAFEPSQHSFDQLSQNMSGNPHVKCHHLALGDKTGSLHLYSDRRGSSHSSLYPRDIVGFNPIEQVAVTTLADFCLENEIGKIHYLKIDAEGAELQILKGAADFVETGTIMNIQFEFGECNQDSRTYFKDFYRLLSPNYDLFLILKDGVVPVRNQSWRNEIFGTSNYLAVLR